MIKPIHRAMQLKRGSAASNLPRILVLALALAFVFTPRPSRAQSSDDYFLCYELCQSNCRDRSNALDKSSCVDTCAMGCKKTEAPPRPFGAIAYGDNRAEGISWNKGSQAEADDAALDTCAKTGSNCKIVYRYRDTCAALAVNPGSQHIAAATGRIEIDAKANAIEACQNSGGKCFTNLSACSYSSEKRPYPPPKPKSISWGAIAYSTADMGAGYSQSKSDRASAEQEAMRICSQRGKSCVLRAAFNKQCAALAADRNFAGVGVSTDMREAQNKATADCTRAGGSRCVLHIAYCSN